MTHNQQQAEIIDDSQAQLNNKQDSEQNKKVPHVLMILDGFGHREDDKDNAIAAAHMPNLDKIYQQYPHGLISASGEEDRKSTRLNSSHVSISYAVFCLKKKNNKDFDNQYSWIYTHQFHC